MYVCQSNISGVSERNNEISKFSQLNFSNFSPICYFNGALFYGCHWCPVELWIVQLSISYLHFQLIFHFLNMRGTQIDCRGFSLLKLLLISVYLKKSLSWFWIPHIFKLNWLDFQILSSQGFFLVTPSKPNCL